MIAMSVAESPSSGMGGLLSSPYLCFISFLYLDLYVLGDNALIS